MKEELREMAGERRESVKKQNKNKKNVSDYLRNLSGLHEEYIENAIYISESKDIEKFYLALMEEFAEDNEGLNKIKEVFSRARY